MIFDRPVENASVYSRIPDSILFRAPGGSEIPENPIYQKLSAIELPLKIILTDPGDRFSAAITFRKLEQLRPCNINA